MAEGYRAHLSKYKFLIKFGQTVRVPSKSTGAAGELSAEFDILGWPNSLFVFFPVRWL